MGAQESLSEKTKQDLLPCYDAFSVMSDNRKSKSGLFGFHGRYAKAKCDSKLEKLPSGKDSTMETKEIPKAVVSDPSQTKKKKFGFRAPVRSASAVNSGIAEASFIKTNKGQSFSADARRSLSFRPAGMETWKMIDDDNASGRSRSSSREKTLKTDSTNKTNSHMTSSLPINLNSSRLPGLINRLTKSNTIDSQTPLGKAQKSSPVSTEMRSVSNVEIVPLQGSNASSSTFPNSAPSSSRFHFGNFGHRKGLPRSPQASIPEKPGKTLVDATTSHLPDKVIASAGKKEISGEVEGQVKETKEPLVVVGAEAQVMLQERKKCVEVENISTRMRELATQASEEEEEELEKRQNKVCMLALTKKDSGQGSSLDASHALTPKSRSSTVSPSRHRLTSDAPLASIDFDDDYSICSDDLMLDVDFSLDADEALGHRSSTSDAAAKKRLSNPRLNSFVPHLGETSVISDPKLERRSSLVRRQRSSVERGTMQKMDRRLQARLSTSSIDSRLLDNGDKNALNELISLMEGSQHMPKSDRVLSRSGSGDAGNRKPVSLKPPRQNSIMEDDQQVVVDGYTYRSMMQELTSMKTMLFRLKRMLQEDDLRTPSFEQPLYVASSGSTGKTWSFDSTTLIKRAAETKGQCPDTEPTLGNVIQENLSLQSMVQLLQHTVEEQKKTIVLLQQQMTKYEFGITDVAEDGC